MNLFPPRIIILYPGEVADQLPQALTTNGKYILEVGG
jgi:hypothetical protein